MSTYGRKDFMAIAAVRYCLGRRTHIVGDCVDWLHEAWQSLTPMMRNLIARDVEQFFKRDDEARRDGLSHLPLGDDMDRREWERARRLWAPEGR